MSVVVTCRCGKQFKIATEHVGKRLKCPACGAPLAVPSALGSVPAAPSSLGAPTAPAQEAPAQRPAAQDPAAGAVIVRELRRLVHRHEAIEAAKRQAKNPGKPIAFGCASGCLTLLAAGIILGLLLGTPQEGDSTRGGLLVLAGLVGAAAGSIASRQSVARKAKAQLAEARSAMHETVSELVANYPQVVAAVGGEPRLREAQTVADVLTALEPRRERALEVLGDPMEWRYWGEAQMLPCPFCSKQTERARLQMMVSGGGGNPASDLAKMAALYNTSQGGKHIEQTCDHCGKKFESRLAPDALALQHGNSFHQWRPGPAYSKN